MILTIQKYWAFADYNKHGEVISTTTIPWPICTPVKGSYFKGPSMVASAEVMAVVQEFDEDLNESLIVYVR